MSTARQSSYHYRPLDYRQKQIRLLVVEAGHERDEVECSVKTVSLIGANPEYETISYVWGDPGKRGTIQINGSAFDVPASSEGVLRRMRLNDRPRKLWIDAVCINQGDLSERAQQVGMMDMVYAKGRRNLIWLGDDDDGCTVQAMEAIRAIMLDARSETEDLANLGEVLFDYETGIYHHGTRPLTHTFDHKPLLQFFSRPWFERLWVAQESVLAKESVCYSGSHEIPLKDILIAAIWMNFKTHFLDFRPHQGVTNAMEIFNYVDDEHGLYRPGSKAAPDMFSLLWELSYFLASDPKDYVYALIGIFRKFQPKTALPKSLAEPDYEKPLCEILRNATIFSQQGKNTLRFLRLTELCVEGSREPDLPTWVPRWGRLDRYMWTARPLDACADGKATMRSWVGRSHEPDVLIADGFVVGHVDRLAPGMLKDNVARLDGVQQILSQATSFDLKQDSSTPISAPIALSLVSGVNWQDKRYTTNEAQSAATALLTYIQAQKLLPPRTFELRSHHDEETHLASQYLHALRTNGHRRRPFALSSSELGLGPESMTEGDIVVVLFGCPWPVVLRPQKEMDEFGFAGCCFVDGIMDGEAAESHKTFRADVFTFRIR